MNIIDIIIIILLLLGIYRWYKIGFLKGGFSVAGIILGIILGTFLAPLTMQLVSSSIVKFVVLIITIGLSTAIMASVGEAIGHNIHIRMNSPRLVKLNAYIGGIFSVFVVLFLVWLLAAIISSSPYKSLNRQIQESSIVHTLNEKLPPAPAVIGRISSLVEPFDFPRVFVGTPPRLSRPVTTASSEFVRGAVANAGLSTIKIEAEGCDSISTGSGFIAGSGLVMTNAHVIAGSDDINIVDTNGRYQAQVVYFDPLKDIAILRTPVLKAPILKIDSNSYARGNEIAILGFPGGGDFSAESGGITREITARGFDIYNQSQVVRSVYEFQGRVVKGNSGGPIVLENGTVIGMVFASAQNTPGFGYALTGLEISKALSQINSFSVGTGKCLQQ